MSTQQTVNAFFKAKPETDERTKGKQTAATATGKKREEKEKEKKEEEEKEKKKKKKPFITFNSLVIQEDGRPGRCTDSFEFTQSIPTLCIAQERTDSA